MLLFIKMNKIHQPPEFVASLESKEGKRQIRVRVSWSVWLGWALDGLVPELQGPLDPLC